MSQVDLQGLLSLPEEMKKQSQWVLVKLETSGSGKLNKIPVGMRNNQIHTVKWGHKENLLSFNEAYSKLLEENNQSTEKKRFHGLGFVLSGSGIMCVDIDNAIDESGLKPFAKDVMDSLSGFKEISVSKTGIHIFVDGKSWAKGTKHYKLDNGSGVDLLSDGAFVMVTGNQLDGSTQITDGEQSFDKIWSLVGKKPLELVQDEIPFDWNIAIPGWDTERIRNELLPRLPDFHDRTNWRDVLFALHHQTRGSQEGLELCHEYSQRVPEMYSATEVDTLWNSIKLNPKKHNKTFRWLLALVRKEITQGKKMALGDIDNAKEFSATFQGELLFCHSNKKWLRFDGSRWIWCDKGEEYDAGKLIAESILEQALDLTRLDPNSVESKNWLSHAKQVRNINRIKAMLELATSEPGMSIGSINQLDSNPMMLGVRNGVLDLHKASLIQPNPSILISRQTNVSYNSDAKCPTWINFLNETFLNDQETIDYIQKALGYSLTGDVSEELLHFCYGQGKNGKSVMANVIVKIMGSYVQTANFDLLASRYMNGATNDIARLAGARLVMANETKDNQRMDDQKLKALVSTEKITARYLYSEYFEFYPTFKFWLRGNFKPIITDCSHGAWRRLRLIPFENNVPDEKTDPELEDKLMKEQEGIFAWMVEGCLRWQKERLTPSAKIQAASRIYQDESDILGEFLEDYCEVGHGLMETQSNLYDAYKSYCTESGGSYPHQKTFTRQLGAKGVMTSRKKDAGIVRRWYVGISLNPDIRRRLYDI